MSTDLLNADEVAAMLNVPRSWVYAETRAGRLPHVRLGRYYRYAEDSIRAFVAGLERGPAPYRRYLTPNGPLDAREDDAAPVREPGGFPHG